MERYSQGVPKMSALPPGKLDLPPHQVVRTPLGKGLKGIILSDKLTGTMIHFYRGRSRPCSKPGSCEACTNGNVARWESYFAAWNPVTGREVTVAITRAAVIFFARALKLHGSLRGLSFSTWRAGDRKNSRVIAELNVSSLLPSALPKEPPLLKMLFHMWEVPDGVTIRLHPVDGITAEEQSIETQNLKDQRKEKMA